MFKPFLLAASLLISSHASAATTTYSIDTKQSALTWEGQKVGGTHTGTLAIKKGSLKFNKNILSGGDFFIDMSSIKNTDVSDEKYNAKLVGHLKSDDFFSVDKHPVTHFIITKVAKNNAANDEYTITGKLTIKGITQTISFPAEVNLEENRASATAEIKIDRTKFNIRFRSASFFEGLGDKVIKDIFSVSAQLVATADPTPKSKAKK